MKYYKIIENEKVIQIGTGNAIPSIAIEINEAEYNEILEEMINNIPEPKPTPSEFDRGFETGYEQALLDLMELELEEGEE